MLSASLHQRTASRYARRAQVGFITLGVGATALAAFALRNPEPVETPSLTVAVAGPSKTGGKATPEVFDASAVDRRLRQIGNYPVPETYVEEEIKGEPEGNTATENENVKYLGALSEPGRLVALMKIGSRQRLLGPGESDGDVTITGVHADRVEILIKGVLAQTLNKEARSGPTVTVVAGTSVAGGPGPNFMGNAATPETPPLAPGGRGRRNPNGRVAPGAEDPSIITAREAAERARAKMRESIGDRP